MQRVKTLGLLREIATGKQEPAPESQAEKSSFCIEK